MKSHGFSEQVAQTLGRCQLIEVSLKLYLSLASRHPAYRTRLSSAQRKANSLVPLINAFEMASGNKNLAAELRGFSKDRNHFVHELVVECMDESTAELVPSELVVRASQLDQLQTRADLLQQQINDEIRPLFVVDEIPPGVV